MSYKSILKVAVLDDGVNTILLNRLPNQVKNFIVSKGFVYRSWTETEITHGTICTALIASPENKIKIFPIKVKKNNAEGHIENLVRALNYCYKKHVCLINISVGSIDDSDQIVLMKPIKQLVEKGVIIVAAVCNSGVMTYPANMPGVLAVEQTDQDECMITYNKKSYVIDIDFPRKISLFAKDIYLPKCNSYYTAIVTRKIADILLYEKTRNPDEVIKKLYMYNHSNR